MGDQDGNNTDDSCGQRNNAKSVNSPNRKKNAGITAGSMKLWSARSELSISWALHPVGISSTFIFGWRRERHRVQLSFGALVEASAQAVPPDARERRYALREVKARLHQASFRDAAPRVA